MKKLLKIVTLMSLSGLILWSCKDDTPGGQSIFEDPYALTKGYAEYISTDESGMQFPYYEVLLTNMTVSEGQVTGTGQALSMKLVVSNNSQVNVIPAGKYTTSGTPGEFNILTSEETYFLVVDEKSNTNKGFINEGDITVSITGSRYKISGTLKAPGDNQFAFEYEGVINFGTIEDTYEFTNGYAAMVSPEDSGLEFPSYEVILTNMTLKDGVVSGTGEAVSMVLVVSKNTGDNTIPEGTYSYSSTADEFKILRSDESFILFVDQDNSQNKTAITDGQVSLSVTADTYTISGSVSDAGGGSIAFDYSGKLEFKPIPPPVDPDAVIFTDTYVQYRGDYYNTTINNYIITATNADGVEMSIEITAPKDNYYAIGEGDYYVSASTKAKYTIINSEFSNFKTKGASTSKRMSEGEMNLMKSGNTYVLTGRVLSTDDEVFLFDIRDELKVSHVHVSNFDIKIYNWGHGQALWSTYHILGQLWNGQKISDYEFQGPCEELCFMLMPPNPSFWQDGWNYQNIASGEYTYTDEFEYVPYSLVCGYSDDEGGDFGLWFHNDEAEIYEMYLFTDGKVNWQTTGSGPSYSYNISGEFTGALAEHDFENEWVIVDPNKTLKITFEHDGPVQYDQSTRMTEPNSNLSKDYVMNATQAYFAFMEDDYDWFGAEDISYCTWIYLGTAGMDLEDFEGATDDDMGLVIAINVPIDDYDIPTGTFRVDTNYSFEPGTFSYGYYLTNSYYRGTWFIMNKEMATIVDGEVTITDLGNDQYKIDFELKDSFPTNRHTISGTFTGEINDFWDFW